MQRTSTPPAGAALFARHLRRSTLAHAESSSPRARPGQLVGERRAQPRAVRVQENLGTSDGARHRRCTAPALLFSDDEPAVEKAWNYPFGLDFEEAWDKARRLL